MVRHEPYPYLPMRYLWKISIDGQKEERGLPSVLSGHENTAKLLKKGNEEKQIDGI